MTNVVFIYGTIRHRVVHLPLPIVQSVAIVGVLIRMGCTMKNSGGLWFWLASPTVKNCVISNSSQGIALQAASPLITNCTIVDNAGGGIICSTPSWPTISNCIVWNNGDDLVDCNATYSCIKNPNDANGVGNITNDPCFVDAGNDDYHLDANSWYIDLGDPNGDYSGEYDMDFEDRTIETVDIGADEYDPNS